jgi:hypothetical protein
MIPTLTSSVRVDRRGHSGERRHAHSTQRREINGGAASISSAKRLLLLLSLGLVRFVHFKLDTLIPLDRFSSSGLECRHVR